MPGLKGFSDNPLRSRDDVVRATEALVQPLIQYMSPGRGRVKIPFGAGCHFDEAAAQLEGFTRPLWAVGALLMGDAPHPEITQPWIDGFETGTDPDHVDYWGPIIEQMPCDQRMVEAEMIAYALLAAPEKLWGRLSSKAQTNLVAWLSAIQVRYIYPSNWLWFRVLVNIALLKVCGVDTPQLRDSLQTDLAVLDQFYIGDGWSSDGPWRPAEVDEQEFQVFRETGRAYTITSGRPACYYSGSFAIQFSQLLYLRFAGDLDPARTEKYRQHARDFGRSFAHMFDADGAPIPFGRSLVYRFATCGFFAALALAHVPDMPAPLATPGAIKGYLLRSLRWWTKHSENIFFPDGTLNLGWVYPQVNMTEDYNSPQSVYWTLKSLVVVGLGADDPFWTEPEVSPPPRTPETAVTFLPGPRHIACNHPGGNHHFILSTAQFVSAPFRSVAAKYSKFAYSSSFGFSVPTGGLNLRQLAPDNVLALSRDGTETWVVKHKCGVPTMKTATVVGSGGKEEKETVPAATTPWYPWADHSVCVRTTVVPPTARWPDWHVRIHRVRASQDVGRLFTAEGGFAIHGRQRVNTRPIPPLGDDAAALPDSRLVLGTSEGILQTASALLMLSEQGASGIATEALFPAAAGATVAVSPLKPDPNTNVMRQRTLLPTVERNLVSLHADQEVVFVTKVFAISAEANGGWNGGGKSLKERWLDQPVLQVDGGSPTGDYISVEY